MYNFKKIEKKWQQAWDKSNIYAAKDATKGKRQKKWYSLIEFPYPSGAGLHVGHVRSNTAMDIVSRKRRMEGYNVLYPIGWDAFGLPTENYAIKTGIQPAKVTKQNTDIFRRQLKALGFSFDWSREIDTTSPEYYKWTQWIFLQFFKHGLAYKSKTPINWCISCKIGLANEETVGGKCERCGGEVEKREKEQWMLKITAYAEKLLAGLKNVDFRDDIKTQQINWIGKSEGSEISFKLKGSEFVVNVFTTRPDTLFGATYLVLAPEHPITHQLESQIGNLAEVKKYVTATKAKTEMDRTAEGQEKTGLELKGITAINPAANEEIPVFIADYVLANYGTGAIMAVPAHDERDFEFAKKFNLAIKQVIEPVFVDNLKEGAPFVEREAISAIVRHWSEDKYIGLKWKKVNWGTFITGGVEKGQTPESAAIAEIREETGFQNIELIRELPRSHSKFYHVPKDVNRFAHFHNFLFKLKDGERKDISEEERANHEVVWLSPAEIEKFITPEGQRRDWKIARDNNAVYSGGGVLVNSSKFNGSSSEEAKKKITESVDGKMTVKYKLRDWVFSRQRYWGEPIPIIHCSDCGFQPVPEKDLPVVLPKVKDFKPGKNGESPLASLDKWVSVMCPHCGGKAKRETDVMPNWAGSSWYFLRYCDPHNKKEFGDFKRLKYWMPVDWYNGGMEHVTLHLLYSRFWNQFLYDIGLVPTSEPYKKRTAHGLVLAEGGVKMSKSKGNVINPDDITKIYGADSLRMYEMFMGPFDQAIAWDTRSIEGVYRFLGRVWNVQETKVVAKDKSAELEHLINKIIKKVSEDIETMGFNTAISAMMIFLNEASREDAIPTKVWEKFLLLLAPFAPHIAEELWSKLGHKKSIHLEPWPRFDPKLSRLEDIDLIIQVNGKFRGKLKVAANISEAEARSLAEADKTVSGHLAGRTVAKVIFVPGRLINFVLE